MQRSARLSNSLDKLERRLDYHFEDSGRLQLALTHCSRGPDNNERLEFLGDSVLNFTISAVLYDRYPLLEEGELTRLRANLVRKDTLAHLARGLELGELLRLGSGELKSGGFNRDSILADALEAVFGAVFLDAGVQQAHKTIVHVYRRVLEDVTPDTLQKDPKTQLQEHLQKRDLATPVYKVIAITGKPHNQSFRVACIVPGLEAPVEGMGRSRRYAEQEAASKALALVAAQHSV
ncbi:MAG: ribonuclease III [Gammaproteobacteria bacterium]|nr:MAG: ribonuclease III [Gammaproteobacteria bacterium]